VGARLYGVTYSVFLISPREGKPLLGEVKGNLLRCVFPFPFPGGGGRGRGPWNGGAPLLSFPLIEEILDIVKKAGQLRGKKKKGRKTTSLSSFYSTCEGEGPGGKLSFLVCRN